MFPYSENAPILLNNSPDGVCQPQRNLQFLYFLYCLKISTISMCCYVYNSHMFSEFGNTLPTPKMSLLQHRRPFNSLQNFEMKPLRLSQQIRRHVPEIVLK